MKNAAFKLVHDVGVCVHNSKNPNKEEWDAYLEMTAANIKGGNGDPMKMKQLVFTDGGSPNAAQRKASTELAADVVGKEKIRVAVVSNSGMIRGIITAFHWLGFPLRSFQPDQVTMAFSFLEIPQNQVADIWAAVDELCAEIEGPLVAVDRRRGRRDAPGL